MRRLLSAVVVLVSAAACATSTWQENDFMLNGRMVRVPASEMQQLRGAWSVPAPYAQFKTALTQSEAQWTADFIALSESLKDRANPCRALVMESIDSSPPNIVTLAGRHTPASGFDEKWLVTACGTRKAYRAYHPQYSTALAVEEVRL
jgi:hypothetical protein